MKISTQAIKFINQHYNSAGDPAANGVDDLVQKIGAQLGAVEEVIPFGKRFDGVIVAKVVSCVGHGNSDHLHVCKIDDDGAAQDVDRDENGHVQVVCGASNVREGLTVAWLPPGATVPDTYDKEPFVLEKRTIRGELSNGMIASARELSLGDNHEGILEIDEDIKPGTLFADAYHLKDDVVIDMENKMFTHRPDCFGWLGIAREIEGIYHRPYKSPAWYQMNPHIPGPEAEELKLEVRNEIPQLVPRFVAVVLRDVEVKQSPVWLQADLARAGVRSINNIVDYTNFFMLETGQPIHAYDYDKVKALSGGDHATIVVRHPQPGEKITLLNGKTIEPRAEAMMVATDKQLICVGGAMGGSETEVDEHTKNVIIEAANWDMYSMRRTSMAHGIFTDAVTRFTKGQSPLQNLAVAAKIVDEIRTFAGGKVASPVIDDNHLPAEMVQRGSVHPPVTVSRDFINVRLGLDLSAAQMAELLQNVEFEVDMQDDTLTITAPFWRTDIEIPEDLVEEVGRLYGYDHLPLELPRRDLTPAPKNPLLELKAAVRDALAGAGANEVLTYSFVHGNLLDKVGQSREHAFQLSNALSPDLQYYRLSLVPSLLERVHANVKSGYDEFALFEIGSVHSQAALDDDGLPVEFDNLGFVYAAAKTDKAGAAYYEARLYLDALAARLGLVFEYRPLGDRTSPDATPFETGRSAVVCLQGSQDGFGIVGELTAGVRRQLKLPPKTAAFEIGVGALVGHARRFGQYTALPRFPRVEQDICLKVPAATTYAEVYDFVAAHLRQNRPDKTYHTLRPLDIYQREGDAEHKQITLRLSIASYERTLTDDGVNKLLDSVAQSAAQTLHAERI